MFPGGFIDGGEEAENFVLVAEVVDEMGKGAEEKYYYNANPGE